MVRRQDTAALDCLAPGTTTALTEKREGTVAMGLSAREPTMGLMGGKKDTAPAGLSERGPTTTGAERKPATAPGIASVIPRTMGPMGKSVVRGANPVGYSESHSARIETR